MLTSAGRQMPRGQVTGALLGGLILGNDSDVQSVPAGRHDSLELRHDVQKGAARALPDLALVFTHSALLWLH